jgi:hypothetical protein
MEAASAAPIGVASGKNNRVTLAGAPVALAVVGAVIGVVGLFLKAFNTPADWIQRGFHGSTTYLNTTGGAKITLGSLVLGVVFLLIARGVHRKGVLWGAYFFGAIAILISVLAVAGGFTVTGSSVKASATIGPIVALVGSVVMFVGAIAARRSAATT